MNLNLRSIAIVVASASYAQAALGGDEKAAPILIANPQASAWSRPSLVSAPHQIPARATPARAGLFPAMSSSLLGSADGSSRLLFLSPLSPLRAALRVAAQDLATQTRAMVDASARIASEAAASQDEDTDSATSSEARARRREVLLRQRRKSVLNEREASAESQKAADSIAPDLELSGLSGRVEVLTLPSGATGGAPSDSSIPGGAGLVRLAGHLTDDLSFAVTGLAAESAATTWRGGAEFELAMGERNQIEVGAVYGTRSNASNAPVGGEVDRRSVGAFRLIHAMKIMDGLSSRVGGRYLDAPFLGAGRFFDPEISFLVHDAEDKGGHGFVRFDLSGDTLFPGLEVVAGESDLIALSEGLPILVRGFAPQRTWTRAVAAGYSGTGSRFEARVLDQSVDHALWIRPSSFAGAPFVGNASRGRVQMGSLMYEKTFAHGQAQTAVEYGFGRFAADPRSPGRARDFHQVTTRFDAYLRRSGTGIAIFHRIHDGAAVASYEGEPSPARSAQRYSIEVRQDVPFVPAMIGADMALLVSLRNLYYDDVERRNVDEFAVAAPPRRITGGIRVKF